VSVTKQGEATHHLSHAGRRLAKCRVKFGLKGQMRLVIEPKAAKAQKRVTGDWHKNRENINVTAPMFQMLIMRYRSESHLRHVP
jgi:DICT domain-containing protein